MIYASEDTLRPGLSRTVSIVSPGSVSIMRFSDSLTMIV